MQAPQVRVGGVVTPNHPQYAPLLVHYRKGEQVIIVEQLHSSIEGVIGPERALDAAHQIDGQEQREGVAVRASPPS
jgi:hypothetical protein